MIYIQTAQGLTQVSPSLTKEKIIEALGYTPADNNIFYEDESGALIVADEKGYIIAKIDASGLTTTRLSGNEILLNGEDLAAKLQALENKVPNIDLSGYATQKYVDDAVADVATDKVITDAHMSDEVIHILEGERKAWNAKSNFSGAYEDLSGAPHIVNDNEDEVIICDSQGNVILRATAEGLNVAAVYVNGVRVDEPIMKFKVKDKVYQMTPSTQLWRDWLQSDFGRTTALIASGNRVNYNSISGQELKDVTLDDYIIPGYTYTYDDYS